MTYERLSPWGKPETYCDVCGRRDSWGCGHSTAQRSAAVIRRAGLRYRAAGLYESAEWRVVRDGSSWNIVRRSGAGYSLGHATLAAAARWILVISRF